MKVIWKKVVVTCIVFCILQFLPTSTSYLFQTQKIEAQAKTLEDLWNDTTEAYLIADAQDLKIFRESLVGQETYEGKTVYLQQDIKLVNSTDAGSIGTVSEGKAAVFQGTFHGRGHCIEGWTNESEALFLNIGKQGKVQNLTMKSVQIEQAHLGTALAFQNEGIISQCTISGSIAGDSNNYASFCYSNTGTMTDCISSADISTTKSKPQLDGIVYSNTGNVTNCVYYGTLSTTQTSRMSLYGIANKNVTNSYFLGEDTYKSTGISCTEESMKSQSTYEGFDFEHIWEMQQGGFPFIRTAFPDLEKTVKVPVALEVSVQDYIYQDTSAPRNCFFPLRAELVYDGKQNNVKDSFAKLIMNYHVTAQIREAEWKSDFMVDVPVNGVSQDFSNKDPRKYFELSYIKNENYEFYITNCSFRSAKGTFYHDDAKNNVLSKEEKEELMKQADGAMRIILDHIVKKHKEEAMDSTWFDFTCARAGYYPASTDKDSMFEHLSKVWKEYKEYQTAHGLLPETTETSKFVLAITALGFDATDVAGDNLITELIESDTNGKFFAPHYLAYALYSGRYGDYLSYARSLIEQQISQSKTDSYSADDMATMYIQPLFLMYHNQTSTDRDLSRKVNQYVEDQVLPWLQRSMTGFGSFYSPYTHCSVNVWTDAQAQMLLALLGEDFLSEQYVKNGNTILDYIIRNPLLSLDYQSDESQCARAIVSLIRCYEGRNNLFDCTDVIGVRQIEQMIKELPERVTFKDRENVLQVQAAYESLSVRQKKQVDNVSVLECAVQVFNQNESSITPLVKLVMDKFSLCSATKPEESLVNYKTASRMQGVELPVLYRKNAENRHIDTDRDAPGKELCKESRKQARAEEEEKSERTENKNGKDKKIKNQQATSKKVMETVMDSQDLQQSSLSLNQELENQKSQKKPGIVMMLSMGTGTGILLLTVGLYIRKKTSQPKKGVKSDEEKNI